MKSHTALRKSCFLAGLVLLVAAGVAGAWDEDGHAIVTYLAHDALPETMPAWLRTPQVRARLAYLSNEPDRWRGQRNPVLDHINNPDHYFDEEMAHPFGLSLKNLPRFRTEFSDLLASKRAASPEKYKPENGSEDEAYTKLSPGLLPYRIAELQWKIAAGWTQLKTYEKYRERVNDATIENARQNIVYHMGVLSHYVGDGAQPLHLTIHHHGWVGENPRGYTTDHGFHSFIDDGIIRHHAITYDDLAARARPAREVSTTQYWGDICSYLYSSFELVEPLYALEKSDRLRQQEGKTFIENRMLEGGAMLAGVWVAAYEGARIDEFRERRLLERYPKDPGRKPVVEKKEAAAIPGT